MSKFCVNCRYSEAPSANFDVKDYTKCTYSYPGEVDLVTGEPKKQQFIYCCSLRDSMSARNCGPNAQFFEAKEVLEVA